MILLLRFGVVGFTITAAVYLASMVVFLILEIVFFAILIGAILACLIGLIDKDDDSEQNPEKPP